MSLMSRKFTLREKLLLLVLSLIMLGIFYYMVVFSPLTREIAQNQAAQAAAQDEIALESVKAEQKKEMLAEVEAQQGTMQGEILPYNNLTSEINELYGILAGASSYNLSFSEAVCSGTIVRRDISVSFQADSFEGASQIIRQMQDSKYRCIVKDVSLSAGTRRNTRSDNVTGLQDNNVVINAGVSITFYETTTGAKDLSGLVMEKQKKNSAKKTGDSNLGDLADAATGTK